MKNFIIIVCLSLLFMASCKNNKSKTQTVAEKIAYAHGFKNWEHVLEIQFTFNVDQDNMHFERVWSWKPKKNQVTHFKRRDTIQYSRLKTDSTLVAIDRSFINDKFWLLAPFQLVLDKDIVFSKPSRSEAPISKTPLNKITVTYPKNDYTLGDAYDIFYNDNYIIQEWVYRKGNQQKPSITTTFENYKDFNGLKLALNHKKQEGSWNVNFTNVKVITD